MKHTNSILGVDLAIVVGFSTNYVLVYLTGEQRTASISRLFKQSFEGLQETHLGQVFSVVLKSNGLISPDNRLYRFIKRQAENCVVSKNYSINY